MAVRIDEEVSDVAWSFQGMDVDEVDALASRLEIQADAVAAIVGIVDSAAAGLAGVWSGDDLHLFTSLWQRTHRSQAVSAGDDLRSWVTQLRQQVEQQRITSGEPGSGGGVGDPLAAFFGGLSATSRGIVSVLDVADRLSALKDVAEGVVTLELFRKYGSVLTPETLAEITEGRLTPTAGFSMADKALGWLGLIGSGAQIVSGAQEHDLGKQTTGTISAVLFGMGKWPVLAPVAAAGEITLAGGSQVLPVDNEEYAGTYDMAMREHFGADYDPNAPTVDQAKWGQDHYSGIGGFFNSIGDGVRYKVSKWGVL